ncbi:YrrS family protein [Ureibacillus sp. GCM10028918]|uniref:YrrS family protein n=1 Tax=Ureibacillus sp. GCM10028918 TaxID=3273429 RepID=UPI003611CBA6
MSKGQESLTRSENKRFDQRKQKNKVDKILNILIAIVSILIVLNVVTIFNDEESEKENTNEAVEKQNVNKNAVKEDTKSEETQAEKNVVSAEELEPGESESQEGTNSDTEIIVQASNDPMVEEVLINPEWKVTPTKQVGEHVSAYEKGHPDYEEKLETFRQAVQLDENNIIFWSVKNNGSADSSVAVVSTSDKTENYRVYIEWLQNEGWKPVKVEKLNQSVGTR